MAGQNYFFIGVTPIIPHLSYSAVVLDGGLHLVKRHEGSLEETLSMIFGHESADVALNFPRKVNQCMLKNTGPRHIGRGRPVLHHPDMRLCEAALHRQGIKVTPTPSDPALCPSWMREGFSFYDRLEAAGFLDFPAPNDSKRLMETQAEAVFRLLLGHALLSQRLLEGRIQRQLLLFEQGLRIADAMEFFEEITRHRFLQGNLPLQTLYSLPELDAMAAAYMAWYAVNHPQQVSQVGDPIEGTLLLPNWKVPDLENPVESQQLPIFN